MLMKRELSRDDCVGFMLDSSYIFSSSNSIHSNVKPENSLRANKIGLFTKP